MSKHSIIELHLSGSPDYALFWDPLNFEITFEIQFHLTGYITMWKNDIYFD